MHNPEIIITEDGSHSLRIAELGENYHSTFGAMAESVHVFIEAGLHKKLEDGHGELSVLEVGYGTGLNALLTVLNQKTKGINIQYVGLEAYPLERQVWQELNYPDILEDERAGDIFYEINSAEWERQIEIIPGFNLIKIKQKLQDYQHQGPPFDLIYFDAFGPDVQPELWTKEIFHKIGEMTAPGGILVTYSCKGSVKRALRAAGFEIEKIPGPKGKREMLRGVKC